MGSVTGTFPRFPRKKTLVPSYQSFDFRCVAEIEAERNLATSTAMILFLDFDGVLHRDNAEVNEYFGCLHLIEAVLRDFSSVSIVISSSWGQVHSLPELRECFSEDMRSRVIDVTPGGLLLSEIPSELWNFVREAQCDAWIRKNCPGMPWLALDDQAWRFAPASPNLLLVDGKTGLIEEDAKELRRRVNLATRSGAINVVPIDERPACARSRPREI